MSDGIYSLDEVEVFLRVRSLEICRRLEVSGRDRSGGVIKETLERAKNE